MMINKRLINLCKDSKRYIVLTVLSNWISSLCNILIIILLGNKITNLFITKRFEMDYTVTIIFICLILRIISNILSSRYSGLASANARIELRKIIYDKLLKLGISYSNYESTSGVVQVTGEGVEQLEVYFGKYLPQFFYALLMPLTLFCFISFISIKAATVFILCVPLIPISIIAIMKIAKKMLKDYWNSYADLGGTFLENLQGLTTLKVFNIDEERHKKMNQESENFRRITMKVLSMQLNSITIMDLVAFGASAAGTIVAIVQYKNNLINVGDLFIIILLSSEFFIPLRLLGSYFHIAMNGMAACDKMFALLDVEEKKNTKITDFKGLDRHKEINVRIEKANFSYEKDRKILKDITMTITNPGVTAIVGESGSGKSTLASLILNQHSLTDGNIFVNGIDINDISRNELYNNIGIVSTNSYIFNGSILDNLLIAKKDASKSEIEYALKKAKLFDFVSNLKDGLNTNVGQDGNLLSGGQKQRLALARVILADRKFIIFDEATSNIDVESEESIWKGIYELSSEKTILVVSHRLANVKKAKMIHVLDNGCVVESGKHEELIDKKGHYFNMVTRQNELENIRAVI